MNVNTHTHTHTHACMHAKKTMILPACCVYVHPPRPTPLSHSSIAPAPRVQDLLDLCKIPLLVAQRAGRPGLQPPLDAVQVEDVAAAAPGDGEARVFGVARGVGLCEWWWERGEGEGRRVDDD